jgi:hypothetical protein
VPKLESSINNGFPKALVKPQMKQEISKAMTTAVQGTFEKGHHCTIE